MPVGFGRVKSKGRPLSVMAHLKRSIIEVKAGTNCLAHDLIIAIARLTNDPNYKAYLQGPRILPEVQHLLQTTGIDLQNGGGINEIQRFQDHFTEYRIVVYGGLDCNDVIFDRQINSEKRMNLLYDDANKHYHVNAKLTHKCRETCNNCISIPPCVYTHVRIPCESCNRTFSSQSYFDKHKSNKLRGRTVCEQKKTVQISAVC